MTAFRCFDQMKRICALPSAAWRDEVNKLPTDCGNTGCTTRNCQDEVRSRLLMEWKKRKIQRRAA